MEQHRSVRNRQYPELIHKNPIAFMQLRTHKDQSKHSVFSHQNQKLHGTTQIRAQSTELARPKANTYKHQLPIPLQIQTPNRDQATLSNIRADDLSNSNVEVRAATAESS